MLVIRRDLVDEIVAHARRDHPDEACGLIAGPEGADRPERFIPMLNAARSPTFYEFDSGDLLAALPRHGLPRRGARGIYHSHTATEAYPSRTDIGWPRSPRRTTCSSSTAVGARERRALRSFRIVDGVVDRGRRQRRRELVVESYMFAHTGADDVPDNA